MKTTSICMQNLVNTPTSQARGPSPRSELLYVCVSACNAGASASPSARPLPGSFVTAVEQ